MANSHRGFAVRKQIAISSDWHQNNRFPAASLGLHCRESHAEASYRDFATFCKSRGFCNLQIHAYDDAAPLDKVASQIDGGILECALPACLKILESHPHVKILAYLDEADSSASIYYPETPRFSSMVLLVPHALSMTNICGGYFLREMGCRYEWNALGTFPNIVDHFCEHASRPQEFAFVLDETLKGPSLHQRLIEKLLPATLDDLHVARADLFHSVFQVKCWVPGMIVLAEEELLWGHEMARAVIDFLQAWQLFAQSRELVESKRMAWYGWHDSNAMRRFIDISRKVVAMADPRLEIGRPLALRDFSTWAMITDHDHGKLALKNFFDAVQREVWSAVRHHPQCGWLDEWGPVKRGRVVG